MEEFGQPEPTEDTPIYISPYEIKQPRTQGKPRKTEEEIKQKKREIAIKHYYENYDYQRLQRQIYVQNNMESILEKQRIYRARKNKRQQTNEPLFFLNSFFIFF